MFNIHFKAIAQAAAVDRGTLCCDGSYQLARDKRRLSRQQTVGRCAAFATYDRRVAEYPEWVYYPVRTRPPAWVNQFVGVVRTAQATVGSMSVSGLTSDRVLSELRPGLEVLGYRVEAGKLKNQRIHLPVLFGDQGRERVAWEVDAVHDELGIVVEIEAGRGARGNALYRDLIRASLLVDVRYLVLGLMLSYRHKSAGRDVDVASYREGREVLDAVYASGRLALPFEGILLFGY